MGTVGLGSTIASMGTQFDFSNMTRGQAVNAAAELFSEGKITADEAGTIDGFAAADYVAAPGQQLPAGESYSPSDPTTHNFLQMFQEASIEDHGRGLTQASANDDRLLIDLAPHGS